MQRPLVVLLLAAGLSLPATAPVAAQDGGGGLGGGNAGGMGGDSGEPPNDSSKPLPIRVNQAIDSGVLWLMRKNKWGPEKEKVFIGAAGNWSDEVTGNRLYDPNAKGDVYVHPTGCTALSLYALLKSGVPKDDPVIKKGFQWLRGGSAAMVKGGSTKRMIVNNRIPGGTYEIAVLILALEAKANPHKREKERERDLKFRLKKGEKLKLSVKLDPEDEPWMKELVDALKKRLVGGSGWRYGMWNGTGWHNGTRGDKDLSASNLAMLAIAAAERCGFQQEGSLYAGVLKWTLGMQEKEGPEVERWEPGSKQSEEDARYGPRPKDHARGFGYTGIDVPADRDPEKEKVPTGSMTCCGLANILICTSFLEARENPLLTPDLAAKAEKAWWDGVAWLDFHWSVTDNINKSNYHYYYLYCLERACDLKGINLLANHPWYNEGAQVLVDDQNFTNSGAWTKNDTHGPHEVLNTCFALLFLNRATPAITGDD